VVEALHSLRRAGTEIVYVPGNHDRPIRRFCGLVVPRMAIRRRTIHVTADGRRLLVVHGDDYDNATHFGSLQEKLGDWLYYRILTGNRLLNFVRQRYGLRYWSLAEFLKRQSGAAERYIARFVQAGFEDAKRRGLDGIVCGHIHRAALFEREGCVYANDGDWVESLTALAEEPDGTLRLLSHTGETLAVMPPRLRLTTQVPELSRAADSPRGEPRRGACTIPPWIRSPIFSLAGPLLPLSLRPRNAAPHCSRVPRSTACRTSTCCR
jgi:UDP-2,3-diacylglucosamine pyrophosphatase LpxH